MESLHPLPLIDRLKVVADLWVEASGRSHGALSTLVTNQGSFFERLGTSRSSVTTATLEKFARYLVSPVNWPDGEVPQEAEAFAHVVGVPSSTARDDGYPAAEGGSPDKDPASIGAVSPPFHLTNPGEIAA